MKIVILSLIFAINIFATEKTSLIDEMKNLINIKINENCIENPVVINNLAICKIYDYNESEFSKSIYLIKVVDLNPQYIEENVECEVKEKTFINKFLNIFDNKYETKECFIKKEYPIIQINENDFKNSNTIAQFIEKKQLKANDKTYIFQINNLTK